MASIPAAVPFFRVSGAAGERGNFAGFDPSSMSVLALRFTVGRAGDVVVTLARGSGALVMVRAAR